VVYAPQHFGGLGLLSLDVEQGIAHILSTIGHIKARTSLGQHLTTLLETYQIVTGLAGNPLANLCKPTYVEAPWTECLKTFLRGTKATIRLPELATILPL
jgi:hypothetical protein